MKIMKKYLWIVIFFFACFTFGNSVKGADLEACKNIDEYMLEVDELSQEYPCDFDKDMDLFPFQAKRLTVFAKELVNDFGAREIIAYQDMYVLQYSTEKETKTAYNSLLKIYGDEHVVVEEEVFLQGKSASLSALVDPPDSYSNWGMEYMGLYQMQQGLKKSGKELPALKVAVIDGGVDKDNPYLSGRLDLQEAKNVTDQSDDVTDTSGGHGTHICGVIVDGTADNVSVLPIKAFEGNTTSSTKLQAAFQYALEKKANLVNLSFATSDLQHNAKYLNVLIDKAKEENIIVCAASGNFSTEGADYYPGNHPDVISVAAMNEKGIKNTKSNFGTAIDFVAPGANIQSTVEKSIGNMSGTSMACPYIVAAAALVKSWNPLLTNDEVIYLLKQYSVTLPDFYPQDELSYYCVKLSSFIKDHCEHHYERCITPAEEAQDGEIFFLCEKCDNVDRQEEISRVKEISLSQSTYVYNGDVRKPKVIVKDCKGNSLQKDIDYQVRYPDNAINVGNYEVRVTLQGKYKGEKRLSYQITKAKPISIPLDYISYTYDGKIKTPIPKVIGKNNLLLKSGIDYTVSYSAGRKNVGIYTVRIQMQGNYQGTFERKFRIYPKPIDFSSPVLQRGAITLIWKKYTTQITGYQIKFADNASFQNAKLYTITDYNRTSKKISGLIKGKKYYAMIKTYKKVDGVSYTSAWSKPVVYLVNK